MLTEMKKIYSDQADLIEGWKDMTKTELCNLYIQNENDETLRNCYFSAIILNYWNKIYTLQANTYLTATLEDTYQWVVDGILYALKHRKWLDPTNKLFTDPDAPDKVINRKIKCTRINHLISENRYKRKIHVNLLSLDSFEDAENFVGEYENQYSSLYDLIRLLCNSGQMPKAFLVDIISNGGCFTSEEDGSQKFDFDLLVDQVEHIDDTYIEYFVKKYHLTYEAVYGTVYELLYKYAFADLWGLGKRCIKKSHLDIYVLIKKNFEELQKDQELRSILC